MQIYKSMIYYLRKLNKMYKLIYLLNFAWTELDYLRLSRYLPNVVQDVIKRKDVLVTCRKHAGVSNNTWGLPKSPCQSCDEMKKSNFKAVQRISFVLPLLGRLLPLSFRVKFKNLHPENKLHKREWNMNDLRKQTMQCSHNSDNLLVLHSIE